MSNATVDATITAATGVAEHWRSGFGDWLLSQRVTAVQQRAVHHTVDHHLSWRTIELPAATTPTAAVWCYLQRLRRDGLDETAMMQVWAALQLYLDYRTSAHPPPSPQES